MLLNSIDLAPTRAVGSRIESSCSDAPRLASAPFLHGGCDVRIPFQVTGNRFLDVLSWGEIHLAHGVRTRATNLLGTLRASPEVSKPEDAAAVLLAGIERGTKVRTNRSTATARTGGPTPRCWGKRQSNRRKVTENEGCGWQKGFGHGFFLHKAARSCTLRTLRWLEDTGFLSTHH